MDMEISNARPAASGRRLFLAAVLLVLPLVSAQAAQQQSSDVEENSVMAPTQVSQVPSCPFAFADTYAGTDSNTSPPTTTTQGYGGNNFPGFFGPTMQLQFNNFGATPSPTQYTPTVPCDGHYEVTFSVEIRQNSGPSCNYGENPMAIWAATTDAASPNAYGCPVTYIDGSGHPNLSPNAYTGTSSACVTFTQWVQCAWSNNFNQGQESGYANFEYYGVQVFPIFMYTPWWQYVHQSYPSSFPYPGICSSSNPSNCMEIPSGSFPVGSYQTGFCSLKPFNFKNIVYLHKGAQISAPALAAQMPYTPYNIAQGNMYECGFSVVGGKFKVVYLGP